LFCSFGLPVDEVLEDFVLPEPSAIQAAPSVLRSALLTEENIIK
jgi:hypothetical protein